MSFTNQTPNFGLPQWIGTDKPTFLGDLNGAFSDIDTALKNNADASAAATATANSASATATSANTNATTALGTANSAASDAASAVTTAQSADTKATQALSAASGAETAAAANTIENLAPAYDNTLTYDVGDLVTFVDAQGHGRLYKCVVAVNSPMDFNINYWDDVTASEVFAPKVRKILEFTADGTSTFATLANTAGSGITFDNTKNYYMKRVSPSGYTLMMFCHAIASTYINFTESYASQNDIVNITYTINNTGSGSVYNQSKVGSNGFSHEGSYTPDSGVKFEIYETI